MDVKNKIMEKASLKFKRDFHCYLDSNNIEVTCTRVDVPNNEINTISSDYEWVLNYWGQDLDLYLTERLTPGFKLWSAYSGHHNNMFFNDRELKCRVDICMKYGRIYEIISFKLKRELFNKDIAQLCKLRGIFSDYANLNWHGENKIALPLRSPLSDTYCLIEKNGIYFGDVYLTRKELLSIKLLLLNKNIYEISAIQGSEIEDELRGVNAILAKFESNVENDFIKTLNYHGITLSTLNSFGLYP